MILDVARWKVEIGTLRKGLESACLENEEFEIEKHLYYLAIAIRKLMDNRLAPNDFGTRPICVRRYPPREGAIDGLNYLDLDAHYDMNSHVKTQLNWRRVIDIIIHSSLLDWRLNDNVVSEFIVSSDLEPTAVGIERDTYFRMIDGVVNIGFKDFPLKPARRIL